MSMDVEKAVAEILRLVAGREETAVALTTGGPVRMERWLCNYWTLRRDQLADGREVVAALWLKYATWRELDEYADRKIIEYVTGTDAYRIVVEESQRHGVEEEPYLQLWHLYFYPATLKIKNVYGNRAVYSLNPCGEEVEVEVARIFQPIWHLCRRDEPEDCPRRRAITEAVKARNVAVEDVEYGVYVPLDTSRLAELLRRVL